MTTSLFMEPALVPRFIWGGESKPLQHPSDVHTSVVVTRSIPEGTCFGPCVFQSAFYDTIAFIAQRSSDNRNKPYVFMVDPEALRNSALLLSWLRLVQAARNSEEQNTEAFLKAGQLYIRTTRDVRQEEELLVWYDEELCHLMGFTELRREPSQDFKCSRCGQVFKYEYPFLAHCRFLCAQVKIDAWTQDYTKHIETSIINKRQHKVTDFHNIARDLEDKNNSEVDVSPKKRKYEDTLYPKSRKTVLLEKTNISNDSNVATHELLAMDNMGLDLKVKVDKVKCKKDDRDKALDKKTISQLETGESSSSSAFSLIASNTQGEMKSAFCKPLKRTSPLTAAPTAPSGCVEEMTEASSRALMGYNLMAPSILNADVHSSLSSAVTLNSAFHYAPEHWSRSIGVHLHPKSSPPSSLTVLPPTLTSLGVSVQNWCAKCNLSFRMTSDLVFHMRSHHKKEFAAESQVRRRREEKLTCPICHEYFRERHHLSRHMTSHN